MVELDIAVTIVTGAFLIGFGAMALGFLFAFGLGSKSAVEMMWEERFRRLRRYRSCFPQLAGPRRSPLIPGASAGFTSQTPAGYSCCPSTANTTTPVM